MIIKNIWDYKPKKEDNNYSKKMLASELSPSTEYLFTAYEKEIVIFNTENGEVLKTLSEYHKKQIVAIAISKDGSIIASGRFVKKH